MSTPTNLFHKWLGLKPHITNPHYFQLLGVSPRLTDHDEIVQVATKGAKVRLAMLKKVPETPQTAPNLKKLKQLITVAHKTLCDPKLRQTYKVKLKSKLDASKSANVAVPPSQTKQPEAPAATASELLPPKNPVPPVAASEVSEITPPAQVAPPGPMPQPNTAQAVAQQPQGAPPATPSAPTSNPTAQTQVQPIANAISPTEIKAAVPLAVPMAATPQQPAIPVAAHPVVANSASNEDEVDAVTISKRIPKRKRSSKLLGRVMALLMLGFAGVGAYLIYDNFDALLKLAKVDSEKVNAAPGIVDGDNTPVEEETPETLKPVDLDSIPQLDEDEVFAKDDEIEGRPSGTSKKVAEALENNANNSDSKEMVDPSIENTLTLSEDQIARLRRSSERAHRNLYRRDYELANQLLDYSAEIAVETGDPAKLVPEHFALVQNISDTKQVIELVKGFWQQVHDSAEGISGAQELVIGSQIVAFVESKPYSVIVRRAGGNIEYNYAWCPPGLALAVAEQGAVPDVPTWNKQMAAFYAVDQMAGIDHRLKINEFLDVAESANHDCEAIRRFSEFSFGQLGLPAKKVELAKPKDVDPAVEEFRNEVGYSRINKVDPEDAIRHASLLMSLDSPNFEQQAAILEEARLLAIQGGSASLAQDALADLEHFAKIDIRTLTLKTYDQLCDGKRDAEQVRDLMERAIPFLNSQLAEQLTSKKKSILVEQLVKLSKKFNMPDAYRRLGQIEIQ